MRLLVIVLPLLVLIEPNFGKENITLDRYNYPYIETGNTLWSGLFRDCKTFPTMSCVQKNAYHYLDETLDQKDVNIGQYMKFTANNIDYHKYTKEANEENNIEDNETSNEDSRSDTDTPLDEVTDALSSKAVKFLMTHNAEFKMPFVLNGAYLRVSPRGFEGDGVLVKLDVLHPKQQVADKRSDENGQPRILTGIITNVLKKVLKKKLLQPFLSLLLILALIKIKLVFLAPILLGVHTAKKIVLKVLLFLFPFLSHLFELCSYYHHNYPKYKYHKHHHQISHIHHGLPENVHGHGAHGHDIHVGPPSHAVPSLHHNPEIHIPAGHPNLFQHEQPEYEFSGPGLGPEYISSLGHRKTSYEDPSLPDDVRWLGVGQGQVNRGHVSTTSTTTSSGSIGIGVTGRPQQQLTKQQLEQIIRQAEKDSMLKIRLQQEQLRLRQSNLKLREQLKQELKTQEQLKIQTTLLSQQKLNSPSTKMTQQVLKGQVPAKPSSGKVPVPVDSYLPTKTDYRTNKAEGFPKVEFKPKAEIGKEKLQNTVGYQQKIDIQQITVPNGKVKQFDPFYSPILDKIDVILNGLGFTTEPCRERLICSMYKNPQKFSPHSNLVSAELSRDSSELVKPTSNNEAVVRFYRYVQAARDGQDQRECLRLYPACTINTE